MTLTATSAHARGDRSDCGGAWCAVHRRVVHNLSNVYVTTFARRYITHPYERTYTLYLETCTGFSSKCICPPPLRRISLFVSRAELCDPTGIRLSSVRVGSFMRWQSGPQTCVWKKRLTPCSPLSVAPFLCFLPVDET